MNKLTIDIETYSSVDLTTAGVHRYVDSEDFKILLLAFAINNEPIKIIDFERSGSCFNDFIINLLTSPDYLKTSWNAAFEITCLNKFFGLNLNVMQWECDMVKAAMCGLPLSLSQCAEVLGVEQQKMKAGKSLIEEFCKPKKKNQRTLFDADKWELFKEYCKQDVATERAISNKLSYFSIPQSERELFALDYKINAMGVMLDMDLVNSAVLLDECNTETLMQEARELTGLANPNSPTALKNWLATQGIKASSLTKSIVSEIKGEINNEKVLRVLTLRQELAKTSTAKYKAMQESVCSDDRVKGLTQFYGTRTGRWAGRLIQVQNLPQNHLDDLTNAREITKLEDSELMGLCYSEPLPFILSQLIRTAIIAPEGKTFVIADFSAIEARVIAWLAGEQWRLDVFRSHGKIYEASASAMFGIPIESVTKGSDYRAKGKIAELALGYQGCVGALKAFGADKMGIAESELEDIVYRWRAKSPNIVLLWNRIETMVTKAILSPGIMYAYNEVLFATYSKKDKSLSIILPSGRSLQYYNPAVSTYRGKNSITYEGLNQTTRKWETVETYGGKLTENVIQAIARDCLADTMLRINKAGYDIVMHVHDEVIVEVEANKSEQIMEEVLGIMKVSPEWCEDLPLRGDVFITEYYKKD